MKEKTESTGRKILRCVLRTLLLLFTLVALIVAGLVMACQLVFNGPSESARDVLTMTLMEASATKWIPGLFIGQEKVAEIQARSEVSLQHLPDRHCRCLLPQRRMGRLSRRHPH